MLRNQAWSKIPVRRIAVASFVRNVFAKVESAIGVTGGVSNIQAACVLCLQMAAASLSVRSMWIRSSVRVTNMMFVSLS
jgi:hypothetical protein